MRTQCLMAGPGKTSQLRWSRGLPLTLPWRPARLWLHRLAADVRPAEPAADGTGKPGWLEPAGVRGR